MLAKSEEIYRLACKYIEDISNNIEETIGDLIILLRMVGLKNKASTECAEFIQSHIKLLKKFLDDDIEVYHGK